ncbi:MAG TPA: hypothetical protein VFE47_06440 [Tepidisphaeraceae bacterium]|nr:hypothetical protein [Tepidisphaeraceae bacterium]
MSSSLCVSCVGHKDTMYAFDRCTVSSDGSKVVFGRMSGIAFAPGVDANLWAYDNNRRTLNRLTSGPTFKYSPSFSPDGRTIAYVDSADDEGGHIYLMAADGQKPRQMTFGERVERTPSFSADGKKIVFAGASVHKRYSIPSLKLGEMRLYDWDIWIMNSDGSSPRQLTFQQYYSVDAPYFDSSGAHIIFGADVSSGSGDTFKSQHVLMTLGISENGLAGDVKRVAVPSSSRSVYDGQPCFSPNGLEIAFVSARDGQSVPYTYDIWIASGAGSRPWQVTHDQSRDLDPIFSPDGEWIYYWIPTGGLWRVRTDGQNRSMLAQ